MASRDDLVDAFRERGHELWLVGGALRDLRLGLGDHDEDFATDALPDEVQAIARAIGARWTGVGQRFGTVGLEIDGRWVEITTFRGESYEDRSRWPDVTFGRSIVEDLARRDFTVNALARGTFTGELLDPYGGESDLRAGVLRAVGEPEARFREDPLRILRGLRFVSQLGFEVAPATLDGMRAALPLVATLSQERVTAELDRLLVGREPGRALLLLERLGALELVLPELVPLVGCEQNRFHRFDCWEHTVATVAAITGDPGSLRVRRWAALLHDAGKPAVRHRKPNGEWGFYRHEAVGEELAAALLRRLRLGRREALVVGLLVRRHMDRPDPGEARSVRRFMARAEGHWGDLLALKEADNASHTYDDSGYHGALREACARVEREEADALLARSPLSGDDLVELFDRAPGPWIRRVKQRLEAAVLDGEIGPGDRTAAEELARALMGRD